MAQGRNRRIADRIRVVVAEMLEKRVKDVRLGFLTVTDVRVSGDNQHASVFYTVFGDDDDQASTAAALESAKGLIRSEVGRQLGMRHTPTLEFIADAVPENAQHIEQLLADARESDAAVAAQAVGKSYAGDADPYRVEEETADGPGSAAEPGRDESDD